MTRYIIFDRAILFIINKWQSKLMLSDQITANQALKNAYLAFRRGEKHNARLWAQHSAKLDPTNEDPWLLLSVLATPRASIAYLEQALKINPNSQRAREGMKWARQRLVSRSLPKSSPALAEPLPAAASQKTLHKPRLLLLITTILIVSLGSVAWTAWRQFLPGVPPAAQGGQSSISLLSGVALPVNTATPTPTATIDISPTPSPEPTETVVVIPSPTPPSKVILVSISEQHLYAYENGMLVYSFIASTGMNNSTRVGTFYILDKMDNAYGSTWDIWMPNWMGIYYSGGLENGIHALPLLSGGGRLWSGYLGSPISFGCVVLGVEDAQLLYDWAEVGTEVTIQW
jgi:lipoprotein-anchoring transpeptidase ErfK/SrfK